MMSTVSFKERLKQSWAVFRWDMKASKGTFVVYSILAAVFSTVILTLCLVTSSTGASSQELYSKAIKYFQLISCNVIFYMTILFAIIHTVRVFSYMHSKRKADLYGALPISRRMLFLTKSVSAYLITLVPAMFFIGIILIISLCLGGAAEAESLEMITRLLIGTLACVSGYGVIAVCCGTTLNSVVMFLAVCIAYPLSAMFIKGIISGFFCGFYSGLFRNHFVMNALNPLAAFEGFNTVYWLIFSAVCIVGSAYLVKKRKSERAQSAFVYYLPCHIVKLLIAFLFGMFLGVLFGFLNVFGFAIGGFIFGFILGSVPAFIISHLIFYKGFSNLLKTSAMLGGLIVAVIGVVTFLNLDVFGYNTYVPKSDEVKSAGYVDSRYCNGFRSGDIESLTRNSAQDFSDKSSVNSLITMHSAFVNNDIFESQNKFKRVFMSIFMDSVSAEYVEMEYCFAYTLNDGRIVTRNYAPSVFGYGIADLVDIDKIAADLIGSKAYIEKYSSIFNADSKKITGYSATGNNYSACFEYNTEHSKTIAKKLAEAFNKDFKADNSYTSAVVSPIKYQLNDYFYYTGTVKDIDDLKAFDRMYPETNAVCVLRIEFEDEDSPAYSSFSSAFRDSIRTVVGSFYGTITQENYLIPESYTNTIAVLKEIGVLNEDNKINSRSPYYYYEEDGAERVYY